MTCVVAYRDKDRVYVGADSLSSSQQTMERIPRRDRKVFRLRDRDDVLIGFCGSYRMGQLLQSQPGLLQYTEVQIDEESEETVEEVKEVEDLDYNAMIDVFVPNVVELFKAADFAVNSEVGLLGGNFFVATKDRFFYVLGDYSVADIDADYFAIGCGGPYAIGALDVLKDNHKMSVTKKIEKALKVARNNAMGIDAPYLILNTLDDEEIKITK